MAVNSNLKGKMYVCMHCGKEFFVPQYEINYRKTIKYCSLDCYHTASRKPLQKRNCDYCGNEFNVSVRNKNKRFCTMECVYAYKKTINRKITIGSNGYKYIWHTDGSGEKEHRHIIEQVLGRKLTKNEVVHHIDGNRTNNDISNLRVMSRGEHSRLHRKQEIESGKKLFGG